MARWFGIAEMGGLRKQFKIFVTTAKWIAFQKVLLSVSFNWQVQIGINRFNLFTINRCFVQDIPLDTFFEMINLIYLNRVLWWQLGCLGLFKCLSSYLRTKNLGKTGRNIEQWWYHILDKFIVLQLLCLHEIILLIGSVHGGQILDVHRYSL